MRAIILANKKLRILADNDNRAELTEMLNIDYVRGELVVVDELRESYELIRPEVIGALTDAPILVPSEYYMVEDNGDEWVHDISPIWFFNQYAVIDPWRQLARYGYVDFDCA